MESLQAKKAGLSKEEIEKIITETRELEEFQKTPSTQEELETIPLLEISDINKNPRPLN